MRSLWEAVAKRGEKRETGGEFKAGLERAKYIEFEHAGHSESDMIIALRTSFN